MRRFGILTLCGALTALAALPLARGARSGDVKASDRNHAEELRRQLAVFQSLPAARQEQVRELDRQLRELEPATRERLMRVMARYAAWLDRLPEEDRKKVTGEPGAEGRLLAIREIRQREWIQRLPKAYRDQYRAAGNVADRVALMEQWRLEEQERDEEWHVASLKHWNEVGQRRVPPPFLSADFRKQVDRFVYNLEPELTDAERRRLRDAREVAEKGNWFPYARLLVELSDRHALLPAITPGPKTYDALPAAVKNALPFTADKLPRALEAASGRWPAFALAVAGYARANHIKLSERLGPVKRAELPQEAREVVDRLEKELRRPGAEKELHEFQHAEGRWPEYAQAVMDLARQHQIPVPGWTLPVPQGHPFFWNQFRRQAKPKR